MPEIRLHASAPPSTLHTRLRWSGLIAMLLLGVGGCASSGGGAGGMVDKTLQAVGMREKVAEVPTGERAIELRMFPGENLNSGNSGRPLALVVRIYHLRRVQRFEQAPFETFLDETREKAALGDDLLNVYEVVLTPGKAHQLKEALPADGHVVGVVALFMAPSRQRWRFSFDGRHKSTPEGITIGLHACAMTTTSPALITPLADDPASLVSARCQPGK